MQVRLEGKFFRWRASSLRAVMDEVADKLRIVHPIQQNGGNEKGEGHSEGGQGGRKGGGGGEGEREGGMPAFELCYLDEEKDEISLDCEADFVEATTLVRAANRRMGGSQGLPLQITVKLRRGSLIV